MRYFRNIPGNPNSPVLWNYTEENDWCRVTCIRCSISFEPPLPTDSCLMSKLSGAANPIKCIQLAMSIEWGCFRCRETTCITIDVLRMRLRSWIRNDSADAYNSIDKLMLLLAHPRCIAAGCSPNSTMSRKYIHKKKKTRIIWASVSVCGE